MWDGGWGLNNACKVDGQLSEMAAQETDLLGRKEEKWGPPGLPFPEKFPAILVALAYTLKVVNESILHGWLWYFPNPCLPLGLGASEFVHELLTAESKFSIALHLPTVKPC